MSSSSDPSDPPQRHPPAARRAPAARPLRARGPRSSQASGLSVAVVDGLGRPRRAPGLVQWIRETMPPALWGEVSIALVGDARMRRLNRTYRGADYATDVLSFPAEAAGVGTASTRAARPRDGSGTQQARGTTAPARRTGHRARRIGQLARRAGHHAPGTAAPRYLGDIVIATGVAARQARERGHSQATELRILALHGLLHLLGHDHERDGGRMAAIERRLRRKGGLAAGLIERGDRR